MTQRKSTAVVPTMQQARRIWRDAIEVVVARLGYGAPARVLAWYDEGCRLGCDEPTLATPRRLPQPKKEHVYSNNPGAILKRKSRENEAVWERERDAAEVRRRAHGVLPREEHLALLRAKSEATREEREARERAYAKTYRVEHREEERERVRERRAAMTLEDRRAEWARHQRARRARLRAAQEAAE